MIWFCFETHFCSVRDFNECSCVSNYRCYEQTAVLGINGVPSIHLSLHPVGSVTCKLWIMCHSLFTNLSWKDLKNNSALFIWCVSQHELTPCMLIYFSWKHKHVFAFLTILTMRLCRVVEIIPKKWLVYPTKVANYSCIIKHDCWCPGYTRNQGIYIHGPYSMVFVVLEYFSFNTSRNKPINHRS